MTDYKNPELAAIEVRGMSRSAFLVRSTLAAGAVYGLGTVSPFVSRALAQGDGDIEILNFALTLEYLEEAFYDAGAHERQGPVGRDQGARHGDPRQRDRARGRARRRRSSRRAASPCKAPGVDFGNAFADEKAFLKLAQTFEDTGVSAYNGAGPMISSPEILGAAGSIVQVEARHAALIRLANGETPAPDAFDMALEAAQVLDAVKPFLAG